MEDILSSYLESRTYLSDEHKIILKNTKENWSKLKLYEKLTSISIIQGFIGEDEPLVKEYNSLKELWNKTQQAIADKHINIYIDSSNPESIMGYSFMGFQGNRQKWIISGKKEFTDSFKNVVDDSTAEIFKEKFSIRSEPVTQELVKKIDDEYGSTNKFERLMTFYSKKDPDDSGWTIYKQ